MGHLKIFSGNPRLDRYLLLVYAAGIAGATAGLMAGGGRMTTHLILLTVYAAAAAPYLVSLGSNAYLSTAFPFILASAVLLGPGAAVMTGAAGGLSLGLARRKHLASYKIAFNVFNYVLGGVAAAFVYRWMGGGTQDFATEDSLRAFIGATCAFYLVSTFMVSAAIALEGSLPTLELWIEKFQWTAYSFLAGGSFALLVILFLQKTGLYSFFVIFPFCALIYHTWKVYAVATGLDRSDPSASTPRPVKDDPNATPVRERAGVL